MIEFTVLEMTLLTLCVVLFFRNARNATKAKAFFRCINAMCEDDAVLKQVKQARNAVERA
jgi:hypothetical protein